MKWEYWMSLYLERHSVARGLMATTIGRYQGDLESFRKYVAERLGDKGPDELKAMDILGYAEYLRKERGNGNSAINRQVVVIKNFYRAMVAMDHMEPKDNPMENFPRFKAGARKLPEFLTEEEQDALLRAPAGNTIISIRDRAMVALFCGTGIRATECATLRECDVDLEECTIRVTGKGGHERVIPLLPSIVEELRVYRQARGPVKREAAFFRSRFGRAMSRISIYERIRKMGILARIKKRVSPHRLRHTFATHLCKVERNLKVIQDLLGHRLITSTQIYLHTTVQDLRKAMERHPVEKLIEGVIDILPSVRLRFQRCT